MTDKPNWTPGPWWVTEFDQWDKSIYIRRAAAEVDCDDVCSEEYDERVANAHLIAAAPELYEALQQARPSVAYEIDRERKLGLDACASATEDVLRRIDAALRKARGEG